LLELVASSSLGSLLGVRHALEPDHLAAMSTLVTGDRCSVKAAWVGACWGVGHTLTLMATGAALVVLRVELPPFASHVFELAVVLLLIFFGVRAIWKAAYEGPTSAPVHAWVVTRRPLLVGAVHGLAGSGALTAAVVAALPSTAARLSYLLLFGFGSIVGMAALSGLLGWPLALLGRHRAAARAVSLAVGCLSTGLGVAWGYPLIERFF
jgi:hypothetical protein